MDYLILRSPSGSAVIFGHNIESQLMSVSSFWLPLNLLFLEESVDSSIYHPQFSLFASMIYKSALLPAPVLIKC